MSQRSSKSNEQMQTQMPEGIDFQIKNIYTRGFQTLYYKRLNLFIIQRDFQYDCWNQQIDNKFQQNTQMNQFLNDGLSQYDGFYGTCDYNFILKYNSSVACIYDLVNLKKNILRIESKFSSFCLTINPFKIIRVCYYLIQVYTLYNKQEKKFLKFSDCFQKIQSGIHISDLCDKNNYFQLRNKSFKILRKRTQDFKYSLPTQYCTNFSIILQKYNNELFAQVHSKCSMKVKAKFKITSNLSDYIEIEEQHTLIILTMKYIVIYNTISFNLINQIQTIYDPKKFVNFMTFNQNMLQIIYADLDDSQNFAIKYL